MRKCGIIIAILVLAVAASLSCVYAMDNGQIVEGLNATTNVTEAIDLSDVENKTIMLVFDQDSCYYCGLLKSEVLADRNVQGELNANYIVTIVDVNEYPQLAGEFQIVGTPTIVFLDSNLTETARIHGYVDADEFLSTLKEI